MFILITWLKCHLRDFSAKLLFLFVSNKYFMKCCNYPIPHQNSSHLFIYLYWYGLTFLNLIQWVIIYFFCVLLIYSHHSPDGGHFLVLYLRMFQDHLVFFSAPVLESATSPKPRLPIGLPSSLYLDSGHTESPLSKDTLITHFWIWLPFLGSMPHRCLFCHWGKWDLERVIAFFTKRQVVT